MLAMGLETAIGFEVMTSMPPALPDADAVAAATATASVGTLPCVCAAATSTRALNSRVLPTAAFGRRLGVAHLAVHQLQPLPAGLQAVRLEREGGCQVPGKVHQPRAQRRGGGRRLSKCSRSVHDAREVLSLARTSVATKCVQAGCAAHCGGNDGDGGPLRLGLCAAAVAEEQLGDDPAHGRGARTYKRLAQLPTPQALPQAREPAEHSRRALHESAPADAPEQGASRGDILALQELRRSSRVRRGQQHRGHNDCSGGSKSTSRSRHSGAACGSRRVALNARVRASVDRSGLTGRVGMGMIRAHLPTASGTSRATRRTSTAMAVARWRAAGSLRAQRVPTGVPGDRVLRLLRVLRGWSAVSPSLLSRLLSRHLLCTRSNGSVCSGSVVETVLSTCTSTSAPAPRSGTAGSGPLGTGSTKCSQATSSPSTAELRQRNGAFVTCPDKSSRGAGGMSSCAQDPRVARDKRGGRAAFGSFLHCVCECVLRAGNANRLAGLGRGGRVGGERGREGE